MDITVFFEKGGDKDFSCVVEQEIDNCAIIGYGQSAIEAEKNIFATSKELKDMGNNIPELTITKRKFDIGSFFNYFPINITQFAKYAGMNASQLRQYVGGVRTPKPQKKQEIQQAVTSLATILMNQSCVIDTD